MKRLSWKPMSFLRRCTQWTLSAIVVLAAWQWLVVPNVSDVFVAAPLPIWERLLELVDDGTIWRIVRITTSTAAMGFAVGLTVGLLLALVIGLTPAIVGKLIEPLVTAAYATPKFILVPILFLWLGTGYLPRVCLIAIAVFPVIAIYTLTGIRTVDPDMATMLRLAGSTRGQLARKLLLPHTFSYIRTAVTYVAPGTLDTAIGAEILFGALLGIGGMLNTTSNLFDSTGVFTALVVGTLICSVAISLANATGGREMRKAGRQNLMV